MLILSVGNQFLVSFGDLKRSFLVDPLHLLNATPLWILIARSIKSFKAGFALINLCLCAEGLVTRVIKLHQVLLVL